MKGSRGEERNMVGGEKEGWNNGKGRMEGGLKRKEDVREKKEEKLK
jgi:hypothetical protein